jgi:cell division protein FtsN
MEKQKTLWIIFSVTLFLVVVVVVGFIWVLPREEEGTGDETLTANLGDRDSGDSYDPIQWVRQSVVIPGVDEKNGETEDDGMLLVIGEEEAAVVESTPADDPSAETSVEAASRKSPEQVPETSEQEIRVAEPAPERRRTTPLAVPSSTPAPASRPKPEPITVTQYWIQAASFSSRTRAEEAKTVLAENGWSARITSREIGGTTYFRVRIGPYNSEQEAQKFLSWLKDLDSFESSYISQVYTTQTLN